MVAERLDLRGRNVVVAGAGGGGIGTAVCRLVAEAGGAVAAVDIDVDRLAVAQREVAGAGGSWLGLVADLRHEDETERVVAEAAARLGPLYGLVHVAGGLSPDQWTPVAATTTAAFEEVLRLNLVSAVATSRAVARRLLDQGEGGSIVHIASIVGLTAMPFGAAYSAAKAGLMSLTRTEALEWGPAGIRVNAVAAGTIRTPKNTGVAPLPDTAEERTAIPLGRRGRPDDVAAAAVFFLSGLADWVSGQVLAVDGGSSARPSYLDADNMPVFVHDQPLRERLKPGQRGEGA